MEGLFQEQNPNAQNGYRLRTDFHFESQSFMLVLDHSALLKICPELVEWITCI